MIADDEISSSPLSCLKKMSLGGPAETLALIGVMGGFLSSIPPISSLLADMANGSISLDLPLLSGINLSLKPIAFLIKLCIVGCAGAGTLRLVRSAMQKYRQQFVLVSSCKVESSDPPNPPFKESGLLLGYSTDTGDALYLTDDELCRHIFLEGQTGVGKTVFMKNLMFQQIERGGGMMMIDGKLDVDNIQELYEFACHSGRKQDFLVINPGQPELSNTYNPILYGDADEVSSRIMNLVPSTSNSAGSDHYKQSGEMALATFIGALKEAKLDYNFLSLAMLTMNEPAIESLVNFIVQSSPDSMARKNLMMLLDQYSKDNIIDGNPNNLHIDLKRLKELLGGIGSRMHRFGTGAFGQVLNSFTPEVVIYDAIKEGKIVYMALPTMGKDMAAENLGKIAIADIKTAGSWLQLNKEDRPVIPFMLFMDENSSYAIEQQAILFEQLRSSRISLLTGVQTDAGFEKISPEFNERVKSNCETKAFYKLSSSDTAEIASTMIGNTRRVVSSESSGETQTSSAQYLQVGPGKNSADGSSNQLAGSETEEFYVDPDKLKGLDNGECIILRGRQVWNIRVPMITIADDVKASIGPVQINHRHPNKKTLPGEKPNKNFDPMSQIDKYLDQSRAKRVQKKKKEANAVQQ